MSLVRLIIPTEVAHDTLHELGELGDVQFKDVCSTVFFFCSIKLNFSPS